MYGPVLVTSRRVGVLNFPQSTESLVTSKRPTSGSGRSVPIPAFIGGDIRRTEGLLKHWPVALDAAQLHFHGLMRITHFDGVGDGPFSHALRGRSAIPKLGEAIRTINSDREYPWRLLRRR